MPGGARPGAGRKPGVPNKATADIKALAQEHSAEAMRKLVTLMRSKNETVSMAAVKELFDRGFGRAKQDVSVSGRSLEDILLGSLRAEAAERETRPDVGDLN